MWYGGRECKGLVEQHSWAEDKVTVRLLDQKLQICCRVEEVWLAELQGTTSQVPTYRPVSRNIDVPKRFVGVVRVIDTGWDVWGLGYLLGMMVTLEREEASFEGSLGNTLPSPKLS